MPGSSDLLAILQAGIDAVRPSILLPSVFASPDENLRSWLNSSPRYLLAMGKAAIDSARSILRLSRCKDYFILAPYSDPEHELYVHVGSHPVPDQRSFEATSQLIDWLETLSADGSLLVILSGGTSALCARPLAGVDLASKISVHNLLIRSGASIHEINAVRKHLSAVKGGKLASMVKHLRTSVLVISDVIGNDLATIGSGPFFPDPTTFRDSKDVLEKHGLWNVVPVDVRSAIMNGIEAEIEEIPGTVAATIPHQIIASNETARTAAADKARELGYEILFPNNPIDLDVNDAAQILFQEIRACVRGTALIAGGEVTIKVQGNGSGGRNQHLALLMAEKLKGMDIIFGAAGTDGIDGNSPAAGAWVDGATWERASGKEAFLRAVDQCDSFRYFQHLGQSIITGPSGTNVMDLYVALK